MKTLLVITFTLISIAGSAQTPDIKEIIDRIDKNEKIESSKSISKQTIITSKGKTRILEMEAYTKDHNEKQLTIYTAPSRVAGDKILMLDDGDEIWFYTPKTDRVRHLASHAKKQKVQGSDFSYEDMTGWDYDKDFTCNLLDKEKLQNISTWKIELIPTETGPHYSKMIVWADTEHYAILQIDYYEDGDLLKRLKTSDIVEVEKHWIAKKMVMKNLQDGGETTIEMVEMKVNTNPDDILFSTNNLSKK